MVKEVSNAKTIKICENIIHTETTPGFKRNSILKILTLSILYTGSSEIFKVDLNSPSFWLWEWRDLTFYAFFTTFELNCPNNRQNNEKEEYFWDLELNQYCQKVNGTPKALLTNLKKSFLISCFSASRMIMLFNY